MRNCYYIIILGLFLLSGCTNREAESARHRVNQARMLIDSGNWNQAKKELDSVHILFPKQVDIRREAKELSDSVLCLEAQRNIQYADSAKQVILHKLEAAKRDFRYEHIEKYESCGRFQHRYFYHPGTAATGLTASVNDDAEVDIRSFLVGSEIHHNRITLRYNGVELSASGTSYVVGNQDLSRKPLYIEVATIDGSDAVQLLHFVSSNNAGNIKVILEGRQNYSYTMSKQTSEALAQTYQLAVLMRDLRTAEEQLNRSKALLYKFQK